MIGQIGQVGQVQSLLTCHHRAPDDARHAGGHQDTNGQAASGSGAGASVLPVLVVGSTLGELSRRLTIASDGNSKTLAWFELSSCRSIE